jgi:hypothetical protein
MSVTSYACRGASIVTSHDHTPGIYCRQPMIDLNTEPRVKQYSSRRCVTYIRADRCCVIERAAHNLRDTRCQLLTVQHLTLSTEP